VRLVPKTKRGRLAALGGLVALLGAGALVLWPETDPVTVENYERIKPGMSRVDVEAMFGPPLTTIPSQDLDPDAYDFGERRWEVLDAELCGREEVEPKLWAGGTGELEVKFARERAVTKAWYPRSNVALRLQRRWERWSVQARRPPEL
jgi:hypothetical protein